MCILALLQPQGGTAHASAPENYTVTASAVGFNSSYVLPNYTLVGEIYNLGVPQASLLMDSTRGMEAFGAVLYPGDTVVAAPGTANGNSPPGSPAAPDYPLIVQASSAHPSSHHQAAMVDMFARVSNRTAESSASIGSTSAAAPLIATAKAAVIGALDAAGAASATATSTDQGLVAGPLRIGRVFASATVNSGPRGIKRSSSFAADGITVAGQTVGLDNQGLVVAGTHVPIGETPLGTELASHGIRVAYLAPRRTPTGVISAGLVITIEAQLPGTPEPSTETVVLGQAAAAAHASGSGVSPGGTRGDPSVDGLLGSLPRQQPIQLDPADSAASTSDGSNAPPVSISGPDSRDVTTSQQLAGQQLSASPMPLSRLNVFWIYGVIVLAGIAALGACLMVRYLGVRASWARS